MRRAVVLLLLLPWLMAPATLKRGIALVSQAEIDAVQANLDARPVSTATAAYVVFTTSPCDTACAVDGMTCDATSLPVLNLNAAGGLGDEISTSTCGATPANAHLCPCAR